MQRTLPGWALALGLTVAGAAAWGLVPRGTPSFGGPFAMHTADGATVTDASLRGAPFVVFFGFTRCGTVCPLTMTRIVRLRRALGPQGEALKVLFVSVDPEDTPEDVARFVASFPLPGLGLTGSAEERARMMDAYRVFATGRGQALSHTGTVFLVGPKGEPRGIVSPKDSDDAALARLRELFHAP